MTRILIVLALLGAAPALAEERSFPRAGDAWYYAVQAPSGPGRTRFAYVNAKPTRDGWMVEVACGEHDSRTGREFSRFTGNGTSERGRMAAIGGMVTLQGGAPSSFLIDLGDAPDNLRLNAIFTDKRCASGWGDLSSGD